MADYEVNYESGFPAAVDSYSPTSDSIGRSTVQMPDSLSGVAQSSIINKHQNQYETRPVGSPGSTYMPHESDIIHTYEGGHKIVVGNRAGEETFTIIGKGGSAIELDKDGRIKIGGKSGFHLVTNGDGHFVLTGDIHFVTNGDLRFKGQSVHFDCADFNVHAKSNIIHNADGNINTYAAGDNHTSTQGDTSNISGGDMRMATAGNLMTQASGTASHTSKGTMTLGSVGDLSLSTQGNLSTTSKGNTTVNSKGTFGLNSVGAITMTGSDKFIAASSGDMKLGTKGTITLTGDGGCNTGGKGALKLSGSSIDAQSGGNKASPDWVSGGNAPQTSADAAQVQLDDPTIVVPDAQHIQDDVGDTFATEGAQASINTSYDLDNEYDVEDGGSIPDKVMQRAKQKGVIDGGYTPVKQVETPDEGSAPTSGFGYMAYHD